MSGKREPKQARSREKVEIILTAAALAIEKYGYKAATTDRIANRAGVSVGTVYQYFENKDEIFDRYLSRVEENVPALLGDIQRQEVESKKTHLANYIRSGAKQQYLRPKVFEELSRQHIFEERIAHLSKAIIDVTELFIKSLRPDLPDEKVAVYAVLWVKTSMGISTETVGDTNEALLESYIEMISSFLLSVSID